jgi:hypothetical protein
MVMTDVGASGRAGEEIALVVEGSDALNVAPLDGLVNLPPSDGECRSVYLGGAKCWWLEWLSDIAGVRSMAVFARGNES